jgi:pyruvate,water dikinase
MHKAKAIITNEGGMACHAAIVAREMNKPCITGTKVATYSFKNGDEVEIDLKKGVVKKIE